MQDGYFAEYAIVDARFCAKLSDSMSYVQASQLQSLDGRLTWDLRTIEMVCWTGLTL